MITSGEGAAHNVRGQGEGGTPAAKDKGKTTGVGGIDGGQVLDQREGRTAGGLATGRGVGNPALRESALGSGACYCPRLAMVAGAASTECHRSFVEVAEQKGRQGHLFAA